MNILWNIWRIDSKKTKFDTCDKYWLRFIKLEQLKFALNEARYWKENEIALSSLCHRRTLFSSRFI